MNNQQIIEKAIEKAKENGWTPEFWFEPLSDKKISAKSYEVHETTIRWFKTFKPSINKGFVIQMSYKDLIFNHDFAKALWGEVQDLKDVQYTLELGDGEVTTPIYRLNMPLWKWHLQQIVISEDPIKYLGEKIYE